MNRAQRRAARFTKAGRIKQAEHDAHYCEHGNPKKTDGRGVPVCPHGCGFTRAKPNVDADHMKAHARVFDADMNELDSGPLDEVSARLQSMPPQRVEVEVAGKRWVIG